MWVHSWWLVVVLLGFARIAVVRWIGSADGNRLATLYANAGATESSHWPTESPNQVGEWVKTRSGRLGSADGSGPALPNAHWLFGANDVVDSQWARRKVAPDRIVMPRSGKREKKRRHGISCASASSEFHLLFYIWRRSCGVKLLVSSFVGSSQSILQPASLFCFVSFFVVVVVVVIITRSFVFILAVFLLFCLFGFCATAIENGSARRFSSWSASSACRPLFCWTLSKEKYGPLLFLSHILFWENKKRNKNKEMVRRRYRPSIGLWWFHRQKEDDETIGLYNGNHNNNNNNNNKTDNKQTIDGNGTTEGDWLAATKSMKKKTPKNQTKDAKMTKQGDPHDPHRRRHRFFSFFFLNFLLFFLYCVSLCCVGYSLSLSLSLSLSISLRPVFFSVWTLWVKLAVDLFTGSFFLLLL